MTTRGLEDLDGGLGSCLPRDDDFPFLEETHPSRRPEHKARGSSRLSDSSSCPHVPQEPVAAGDVGARPKKTERELLGKGTPGTSKEKPKGEESPRSAPARKKSQALPPQQPPPPPPAPLDVLPWGDLTLNKCLVLASLLALLGAAFQQCRDMVAGEAVALGPGPQPWMPPSSAPKKPVLPLPPSESLAPKLGPLGPKAETENRTKVPRSPEAAGVQEDPGKTTEDDSGEEPAHLQDGGSQERPQKEKLRKEGRPRKERRLRPQKERLQVTGEPREVLPQRWEARDRGHRPWARESRDPAHWKRQPWASLRRHAKGNRPLGGQKHHGGKGRD